MTRFRMGHVESGEVDSSFLVQLDDRIEDGVPYERSARNDTESESDLRLVEVARNPCLHQPDGNSSATFDSFRFRYLTKYIEPYETLSEDDGSEESDVYDPYTSMEFVLFSNGVFLYETTGDPDDAMTFLCGEDKPTPEYGIEITLPTLVRHYQETDEVSKVTLGGLEASSSPSSGSSTLVAAVDQFAGIADKITISTGGAKDQDLRDAELVGLLYDRSDISYLSASYEGGNTVELSRNGWMQSSFPEKVEPERRARFIQNRFAPVIEQVASRDS